MRAEGHGKVHHRTWKTCMQSFADLIFGFLSRTGHEKSCLNLGRPRSKAKYVLRSIVNKYREGKAKRTPEGEWNRTWNCVLTRSRSLGLPGWLRAFCRTIQRVIGMRKLKVYTGGIVKASFNRASTVHINRPETRWPIHEQAEAQVKLRGGPNRSAFQHTRMTCG